MTLSDIIDSAALVVSALSMIAAFAAILYSNKANRNIQRITLRLDFSQRYQEIMLAMPDSEDPKIIKKYVLLYFDLCSEEYRLWKSNEGIVDKTTWQLWEDGMHDLMDCHAEYRTLWKECGNNYKSSSDTADNNFHAFFSDLVEGKVREE